MVLPAPLSCLIRKYRSLARVEENCTSHCRVSVTCRRIVAVGWIAAHAEYCQYSNHISVEKCNAYELATLVVDTITGRCDFASDLAADRGGP
jgi:hypothetical protein